MKTKKYTFDIGLGLLFLGIVCLSFYEWKLTGLDWFSLITIAFNGLGRLYLSQQVQTLAKLQSSEILVIKTNVNILSLLFIGYVLGTLYLHYAAWEATLVSSLLYAALFGLSYFTYNLIERVRMHIAEALGAAQNEAPEDAIDPEEVAQLRQLKEDHAQTQAEHTRTKKELAQLYAVLAKNPIRDVVAKRYYLFVDGEKVQSNAKGEVLNKT